MHCKCVGKSKTLILLYYGNRRQDPHRLSDSEPAWRQSDNPDAEGRHLGRHSADRLRNRRIHLDDCHRFQIRRRRSDSDDLVVRALCPRVSLLLSCANQQFPPGLDSTLPDGAFGGGGICSQSLSRLNVLSGGMNVARQVRYLSEE